MDAWDLYEGIGLAYAMTNRNAEALVAFEKAEEAGMPLPYGKLQEAQFNTACALALWAGQRKLSHVWGRSSLGRSNYHCGSGAHA